MTPDSFHIKIEIASKMVSINTVRYRFVFAADNSSTSLTMAHHDSLLPSETCDVDVDFQSSVSHMGLHWSPPASYVTEVKWGIQQYNARYGKRTKRYVV